MRLFSRFSALFLALSVFLAIPALAQAAEVKEIKVGFVLPLTGAFAEAGQLQKEAVDMAIADINNAGGIKSLGGAKLVPVYGSFQSDVAEANTETQRLITREKVVGIIGPYSSGAAISGTEIAEREKVPYLVPNALSDEITARGLKYTFQSVPRVSQFAQDAAKLTRWLSQGMEQPKTCVILRADDYFGNVVSVQFQALLPENGFEILEEFSFPVNTTSMEDIILAMKNANPDVVFASGEPAAIILLFQQLEQLDYWPTYGIVGVGGGYSNPHVYHNLGALADGLISINDWFPDANRPGAKELNERFKKATGVDMLGNANTTYAGVHIFSQAIEKAASTDPMKIRDALASLELTEGAPMFMYEKVQFNDKGVMVYATNIAAQIEGGKARVIWPEIMATEKAEWPVPTWKKR